MKLAENVIREDLVKIDLRAGRLTAEYFSWTGEFHWKAQLSRGAVSYRRREFRTGCPWRIVETGAVPDMVRQRIVRALKEMDMMSHTMRALVE